MSKNVNYVGAKNLRKLRNLLGVKQYELECEGAPNISQLETGAIAITKDVSAPALKRKIIEISEEKGITLPDDIKLNLFSLLLGKINIITNDILKKVDGEKVISKKSIKDIDDSIKDLSYEDIRAFLNDLIQILSEKDMYVKANAKATKKYANKFLQLNLDNDYKIRAYRQLIRAHLGLRDYEEVVDIADLIENELEICKNKEDQCSCYNNIALACHKEGKLDESAYYFKKAKQLGKGDDFFILTLESARDMKKKKFKEAEKGYLNILNKAKNEDNNDYIVESLSNLADVYYEDNIKEKSKESIDEALNSIICGTSKVFRANAYFNAFNIYNKFFSEDIEKIEEFFWAAFQLLIDTNHSERLNDLLEKAIDRYLQSNEYEKIYLIIDSLKGVKDVSSDPLLKIIENMKNRYK